MPLGNGLDVSVERVVIIMVGLIGAPGKFVPFAGEDAFTANTFKCISDAAYPGEQVDEVKFAPVVIGWLAGEQATKILVIFFNMRLANRF